MPLPWSDNQRPLMLGPMQGLTNRVTRSVFAATSSPDVLFTEFVRVRPQAKQVIADSDYAEATSTVPGTPLVVQVIGSADEGVIEATRDLVARGVEHINVNMGCPWGRMTSVLSGGGMFRAPETVGPMLSELRAIVPGSLSVKTRAGLDDDREIFTVLDGFAAADIDFLIVHPRTVAQKYRGDANHALTRELVASCPYPVIANGDVTTVSEAQQVMDHTGAAGLMLGRGAIADPLLFDRIRGSAPASQDDTTRRHQLARHYLALLDGFEALFFGDAQVLAKLREHLAHVDDDALRRFIKGLKKARSVDVARTLLREALAT
jgi:tRNA-dihydrouridine synthase